MRVPAILAKKVAWVGAGMAAASLLLGAATFGLFYGTAASQGDRFAAGTVTLGRATPPFDCTIAHLEPGDNGTCRYSIAYTGSLNAWVALDVYATTTSVAAYTPRGSITPIGGEALLADRTDPRGLQLSLGDTLGNTDLIAPVVVCPSGDASRGDTACTGTADNQPLLNVGHTGGHATNTAPEGAWATGQQDTVVVHWRAPLDLPNVYQGGTVRLLLSAHAVQASNNPLLGSQPTSGWGVATARGLSTARGGGLTVPLTVGGPGTDTPDTTVTATGGSGTVTITDLSADPVGPVTFPQAGSFFDVRVAGGSTYGTVTIHHCQASPPGPMYWWSGTAWFRVSQQEVVGDCVSAGITATTAPSVFELTGTAFTTADASTQVPRGYLRLAGDQYPWIVTPSPTCALNATPGATDASGGACGYALLLVQGGNPAAVALASVTSSVSGTEFEVNPAKDGSQLGIVPGATSLTVGDLVTVTETPAGTASSVAETNFNDQIGVVIRTTCASGCDAVPASGAPPEVEMAVASGASSTRDLTVAVAPYTTLTLNGSAAVLSATLDGTVAYAATVGGAGTPDLPTKLGSGVNIGTQAAPLTEGSELDLYDNEVKGVVSNVAVSPTAPNAGGSNNPGNLTSLTLSNPCSAALTCRYVVDSNFSGVVTAGDVATLVLDASGEVRTVVDVIAPSSTPAISSVSFSGSPGNYTVTVIGSGFGTLAASLPHHGDTCDFRVADGAQVGFGEWGYCGDAHALTYETWTSTKVVVSGFGGKPGDSVVIAAWNPQTGAGADWGGDVPPVPAGAPTLSSVTFSGSGANATIDITGSGFGASPVAMPFTGNLNFLAFWDGRSHCDGSAEFGSGGGWGINSSNTTLRYLSWTPSEIRIAGFAGSYGTGCATVQPGDPVAITVWASTDTSYTGPQAAWGGRLPN